MDSSFLPSLIWIIVAIVTLALWRSAPMMARIGVMGASGSLGIWLLQRDWTLVGGGLLGVGLVLAVVTGRTLFGGPPSLKHPVMILGVSTLVMLAVVGVGVPYIDDVRVKDALVVVMVVVGAAFLIAGLVSTFQVVREQLRLRERTR
jgi:hypothetical protein